MNRSSPLRMFLGFVALALVLPLQAQDSYPDLDGLAKGPPVTFTDKPVYFASTNRPISLGMSIATTPVLAFRKDDRLFNDGNVFLRLALDTNQLYTVTFQEYIANVPAATNVFPLLINRDQYPFITFEGPREWHKLVRLTQGDLVLYDREICPLHQAKMELRSVPLHFGSLYNPGAKPNSALYPNYHESLFIGCAPPPNQQRTANIYSCPQCQAAFEKWRAANAAPAK